jgi:hypothetical protein
MLAVVALLAASSQSRQRWPREVENVASFARLYGVLRYFYPSDAAASLDWNAFAVHGVGQVHVVRDGPALDKALRTLVESLGPRIAIGTALPARTESAAAAAPLVAWHYLGAAVAPASGMSPYQAKRTNRVATSLSSIDGFVTLLQSVSAASLKGHSIRLRGQIRARASDDGSAAMWLRVDRRDGTSAFFDNMASRPVRSPDWGQYSIEGTVSDDAETVFFGVMASGAVTADFDAIELAVRDPAATWRIIPFDDAGFDDGSSTAWRRGGNSKLAQVARIAEAAPQGSRFLRFSPPPPVQRTLDLFPEVAPIAGTTVDVNLGSGLTARVPLVLSDQEAASTHTAAMPPRDSAANGLVTRLADVVVAWNVFRHFYPYWKEAAVDWDDRLRDHLALAHAATTRQRHHDALRQLVADARDGHGNVLDTSATQPRAFLPLRFMMVGNQVVVTASGVATDVPTGAVVIAIDGVPASRLRERLAGLISGTTQWKQARAAEELASCVQGATVRLTVDSGRGPQVVSLKCDATPRQAEARPAAVSELRPGVWYVDLTRAPMTQISPEIGKLARADRVVFDMRGYPTDAGAQILPHLIDAPENDRWMHVAKIVGPFGQVAGWHSLGWNVRPRAPRLAGTIVFLTDGRAISYAESVMRYVADRRLATIVGSPTAGTNGNVATFLVPGGFRMAFTGMRVTGHDGHTPHHLAGIVPHVAVKPTVAGVRAGRDELLERALSVTAVR